MFALMSLWSRLSDVLARLPLVDSVTPILDRIVEAVRSSLGADARRQVAFTVSMIALSAKMAKADGVVTEDEVSVVKRLFEVPDDERRNVARLFNLAKQDVAGFEAYAHKILALHAEEPQLLEDIVDGLFVIAKADGIVHDRELAFLERVAEIFQVAPQTFVRIQARHVRVGDFDPYLVLGIPRGSSPDEVKTAYRRLATEHHPDRLVARGVPAECIRLATDRMASLNKAYTLITRGVPA
ncbi:molecular chaperone DjiA [Chthonobacter rhizosphaerae]|uniref:molecular chaperone DjiA n=1 Tax=Chthonobacter rhizosphaerae TaxID=2735553 RepID=UPI001FE8E983|nr:molecular chaperone DjiA [Chthonobacter rhizosphaerae]